MKLSLSTDYIYASERAPPSADPEDILLSGRLIWLNRLYSAARLPLMEGTFNVNFLVDLSANWEPDNSAVHPETRLSLEFQPRKFEEANLAFALTWAKGEFSPTFADEDAFLAGLRWKF